MAAPIDVTVHRDATVDKALVEIDYEDKTSPQNIRFKIEGRRGDVVLITFNLCSNNRTHKCDHSDDDDHVQGPFNTKVFQQRYRGHYFHRFKGNGNKHFTTGKIDRKFDHCWKYAITRINHDGKQYFEDPRVSAKGGGGVDPVCPDDPLS